jgi:hypothetical protein
MASSYSSSGENGEFILFIIMTLLWPWTLNNAPIHHKEELLKKCKQITKEK